VSDMRIREGGAARRRAPLRMQEPDVLGGRAREPVSGVARGPQPVRRCRSSGAGVRGDSRGRYYVCSHAATARAPAPVRGTTRTSPSPRRGDGRRRPPPRECSALIACFHDHTRCARYTIA
jgi:hypothetical protein